jgi:hypothetical protein
MTESLGATLVPYNSGDVVKQLRELLPGGVDAILDLVGSEPMRHVAILITNPARIVSVADPSVTELRGSFLQSSRAGVPAVANLVAAGKVDPKALQTYPFDQAPQALRAVESGHTLGKIVIDLEQTTQVWPQQAQHCRAAPGHGPAPPPAGQGTVSRPKRGSASGHDGTVHYEALSRASHAAGLAPPPDYEKMDLPEPARSPTHQ